MKRGWGLFPLILLYIFVLGEAGVRLRTALSDKAPPRSDRSLRREWRWALEHLAAGTATFPGYAGYDPELGWRMTPNLVDPKWRTNSVGMHAYREFSEERVSGKPRILLVGDSYTFGFEIDYEHAFHSVLEREFLPDWEVLNLAVPGYGPAQILLMYEKMGVRYQPDVVVFGFYVRGFFRLSSSFRSYAKPRFILNSRQELELRGVPVISPQALFAKYTSGERRIGGWDRSYLLATLGSRITRAIERRRITAEAESWALMAAVLRRFSHAVTEAGSQPFLLIIPARPATHPDSVYEDLERLALAEARELGLPSLSLQEGFSADSAAPVFRKKTGGHLAIEGNRLMAQLLYRGLLDAGLVNTNPG
jgi:hypothetical protein